MPTVLQALARTVLDELGNLINLFQIPKSEKLLYTFTTLNTIFTESCKFCMWYFYFNSKYFVHLVIFGGAGGQIQDYEQARQALYIPSPSKYF